MWCVIKSAAYTKTKAKCSFRTKTRHLSWTNYFFSPIEIHLQGKKRGFL